MGFGFWVRDVEAGGQRRCGVCHLHSRRLRDSEDSHCSSRTACRVSLSLPASVNRCDFQQVPGTTLSQPRRNGWPAATVLQLPGTEEAESSKSLPQRHCRLRSTDGGQEVPQTSYLPFRHSGERSDEEVRQGKALLVPHRRCCEALFPVGIRLLGIRSLESGSTRKTERRVPFALACSFLHVCQRNEIGVQNVLGRKGC